MNWQSLGTTVTVLATLVVVACGGASEAEERLVAGVELQREGRLEEAIAQYDEAIRLDPLFANAYTIRGIAYRALGQPEQAIEDFDQAIQLDPQAARAFGNRARVRTLLGQDEGAQQDLGRAVQLGFDRARLEEDIETLKSQR